MCKASRFLACSLVFFASGACTSKEAESTVFLIDGAGAASGAGGGSGGGALVGAGGSQTSCAVYEDRDGDGVSATHFDACENSAEDERLTRLNIREDCDDEDPLRWQTGYQYVDADDDGYASSSAGQIGVCEGEDIPGYTEVFGDCDDEDALAQVSRYLDEDGDGFGAGGPTCVAVNAPQTSDRGDDCDDEDGDKNLLGYMDEDQDGFASEIPTCSIAEEIDDREGTDCDDSDASIFAEAEEEPLDDVDSNCDGLEFPAIYYGEEGPVDFVELSDPRRCEGRALSIVALERPDVDHERSYLQFFNRGSERLEGVILELTAASSASTTPPIGLAPIEAGEFARSPAISGQERRVRLVIEGDRGECDYLNELADLDLIERKVRVVK